MEGFITVPLLERLLERSRDMCIITFFLNYVYYYLCANAFEDIGDFSSVLCNVVYKANRLLCTNFVSEDDYITCAN